MNSKTEKKYLAIMRKKSGQERLKIAMDLRKLVLKLAEVEIKLRNPRLSPPKLREKLLERIYGSNFSVKTGSK